MFSIAEEYCQQFILNTPEVHNLYLSMSSWLLRVWQTSVLLTFFLALAAGFVCETETGYYILAVLLKTPFHLEVLILCCISSLLLLF